MPSSSWRLILCITLAACGGTASPPPGSPPPTEGAHVSHGPGFHHRFDDPERWAKEFDNPARDDWQKPGEVVAAMELAANMTVVDLGAGTGYFLPHLRRGAAELRVIGIDVEPKMVAYMRERAERDGLTGVEVRLAQPNDPGLPPGSVDRILIVDTWHHVDDRPAYATKLYKALKPGGKVFVIDFTLESKLGPPKAHRLSPEAVSAELRSAGFRIARVAPSLPEQYAISGSR